MRILIVSTCPSHPTIAGNRRFILDQTEMFSDLGHEVFFLYIHLRNIKHHQDESVIINSLKGYWNDRLFLYHQSIPQKLWSTILSKYRRYFCNGYNKCDDRYPYRLHHKINKLDEQYHFGACLVNYFYLTKAFKHISIYRKGLITHDYFAYKSLLVGEQFVLNNISANEEAKAMQRSSHIFALNEGEAEYFQRLSPLSKVYCIFGSFVHHISPIVGNHNILFLSGSNQYNVKGLKWFLDNVFDSIENRFPDVKLYIGGAICDVISNWGLDINVILVGSVDNSDDFYSLGDVAINPTYQGTGLKIKTFEAVAKDKVTMVHPHSVNGIFRKSVAPIFASEKPDEWVSYLVEIWGNTDVILKVKERNKEYLEKMNEYIINEYNRFFNYQ